MGTFVYAGAARWGAARNSDHKFGLFRLDTDSGEWRALKNGLPENVEVRHMTFSKAAYPPAIHKAALMNTIASR